MELPFNTDINTWTWDTVLSLSDYDENQYLEYKETVHPPDNNESSESEWRRKLEREITAFTNANGGILVFGIDDEGNPSPFERPDHELNQSVTRLIQNTRPLVDVDISGPIEPPTDETERVVLVVRVNEAKRKPVLTSDAAVYQRINDRKEPMGREQMEALFVEHDRRQQAVRQLEMEIDRFYDIYEGQERRFAIHSEGPPNYHLLNIESLQEVLRENTHLYTDEELKEAISSVFQALREVEDDEVYFGRAMGGYVPKHEDSNERFYKKQRRSLNRKLDRVERELKSLADEADLQVKLLEE